LTEKKPERSAMAPSDGKAPTRVSTRDLFGSAHEVVIDHEGALYRLRITRQGKLILNK
jgi:hemin uptake protein HemP